MKYIATWSPECKSVFRWPIKETNGELRFDQYYVDDSLDIKALIGVSDVNHVILHVERDYSIEDSYNFEIVDIVNSKIQALYAKGLKGEVVYHSGKKCLQMCLNNDNTLLSVGETKIGTGQGDDYKKPALIAIYSVKDAIDKLDDTLNEGGLILDNMRFIGSNSNERLLFSFYIHENDQRQFFIVNPHSLTIKDAELLFRDIECYKRQKTCTILFNYIINVEKDHLNIKSLADYDSWSNYIKKRDVSHVQLDDQDNEFDPLFKNKSFDKLIDSFYGTDSYYKYLEDTRIAESTIEELQKYIQKIEIEKFEESSKPFIFPHIYKIANLDTKTIDDKLNDLDGKLGGKLDDLDGKLNNLIEDIKKLKSDK
ncbi:2268_t:CDS:2 [Dentiscutata heterogama]|uniref:2268_t:CDS:1 n=1 Tax=Dentiscutata heterogama TaxID=1316150 RepID=A0ACA9JV27_9GLOM|nr:2268_t:CDS:2 [Dentiscutata heterogama]